MSTDIILLVLMGIGVVGGFITTFWVDDPWWFDVVVAVLIVIPPIVGMVLQQQGVDTGQELLGFIWK